MHTLIYIIPHLLIVLDTDNSLAKLSSWDSSLEQNVELSVRPILHLRKTEVGNDEGEQSGTSPNVSTLSTD